MTNQPPNPPTDTTGPPKDVEQREPLLVARHDATSGDQMPSRTVPVSILIEFSEMNFSGINFFE